MPAIGCPRGEEDVLAAARGQTTFEMLGDDAALTDVPDRAEAPRAVVVRRHIERAAEPIVVPPSARYVVVVVHAGGAAIGQVWLTPQNGRVAAEAQEAAIDADLGWVLRRREARQRVAPMLGVPGPSGPSRSVSVVVCTRDRLDDLRSCLRALAELRRTVELLVVDNAGDHEPARRLCAELGVRCVHEPRPGQTRARNRGIAETSGEVVAFTDDDVLVDPGWLDAIDAPFGDPLVMAATGYVGPAELRTEAQLLFELNGGFQRHSEPVVFEGGRPLVEASQVGAGANMVLRRDVFGLVGTFDESFGPGTATRTSDDKVMFYEILRAGYRIHYDPARIVWHRHRDDLASLRRLMEDWGTGEVAWTARALLQRRDPSALAVWRWWLQHYGRRAAADLLRRPTAVPRWMVAGQLRGVRSGARLLRHGLPHPPAPPGPEPRSQPELEVTREPPLISVALASYNRRERLRGALTALARQTLAPERYELVVVLDGSTDGSAEMVRGLDLPVELRIIEQDNAGLAAARNVGAAAARHPIVLFLDDDIEARPELVAAHAGRHAALGRPAFVMGYFPPVIDEPSWWAHTLRAWWADHFRQKGEPGHRWSAADIVDGNASVSRALFDELGQFDLGFTGGRRQDYEFGLRLLAAGHEPAYEPRAYGDHHLATDVRAAWANVRAEGRYDVLVAHRHPDAAFSRLPGVLELGPAARVLRYVASRPVADSLERTLTRLERLNLRQAWRAVAFGTHRAFYALGVQEGIARYGRPTLRPSASATARLDLDRAQRLAPGPAPARIEFLRDGRVAAVVQGATIDRQWASDEVLDWAVHRLAASAGPGGAP